MDTQISHTDITKDNVVINSLFEDFIITYTIITIETVGTDITTAYQQNKLVPSTYDFHRTILVTDDDSENYLSYLYQIIYQNPSEIHKCLGDITKLKGIFGQVNFNLCAYTTEHWDDVRYFTSNSSTYLAEDQYTIAILQTKVMEMVKHKFYDRDILAHVCLDKNPEDKDLSNAINIIKKQEVDFLSIGSLLPLNDTIHHTYEKLVLKDKLSTILSQKDTGAKKTKV